MQTEQLVVVVVAVQLSTVVLVLLYVHVIVGVGKNRPRAQSLTAAPVGREDEAGELNERLERLVQQRFEALRGEMLAVRRSEGWLRLFLITKFPPPSRSHLYLIPGLRR